MDIKEFQILVKVLYEKRGYTLQHLGLALGISEEAGEIAKAINVFHNPLYKPNKPLIEYATVEHEMIDLLVYLCQLATVLEIDLSEIMNNKANEICKECDVVVFK